MLHNHRRTPLFTTAFATILTLAVLLAAPAFATPATGQVADVHMSASQVQWVPIHSENSLHLTISGPAGVFEQTYAAGQTPIIDLAKLPGDLDGSYSWRLSATPKLSADSRRRMAEARANGTTFTPADLPAYDQLVQSGHFRIHDGAVIVPSATIEPELGVAVRGDSAATGVATGEVGLITAAAQVVNQDQVIKGNQCVGTDCLNSESYGFDSVRLKENNLRIHFDDTSSSGSFPKNDWRLVANDTDNGGDEYFAIQDATANKTPFRIDAGAKNNSLYVSSDKMVGVNTNAPAVALHVVHGDTPALRLHQDGSSGFQTQVWDVGGNESNFFIRDITNSSTLPLRIKPGAPENSIFVTANGYLGLGHSGTTTFSRGGDKAAVYVKQTDAGVGGLLIDRSGVSSPASDVLLELRNNGTPRFDLVDTNSGSEWRFEASGTDFNINDLADGQDVEFSVDSSGNLTIMGDLTANGTNYSSSRSLKEGFSAVDSRDVLERLASVPVSLWNYKSDQSKRPHIGPVTEDFSAAFDFLVADGKLSTVDMHGVAMAAIQGLNEMFAEQNGQLAAKDAQIVDLQQRLAALEARLGAGDGETPQD